MLIVDDSQVPTAPTKAVVDGQGGGGGMEGKEGSKVQVGMRVGEGMEGPMLEMLEMEDLEAKEEQELPVGMGGCWILCPFSIQYWHCGNIWCSISVDFTILNVHQWGERQDQVVEMDVLVEMVENEF